MKYGWKGRFFEPGFCSYALSFFDLCLCWLHIIFSASDQAGPVGLCLQIHTLSLSLYLTPTRTRTRTRTHAFLHSFEGFRTLVIVLGMLSQKMLWIPICGCAAKEKSGWTPSRSCWRQTLGPSPVSLSRQHTHSRMHAHALSSSPSFSH